MISNRSAGSDPRGTRPLLRELRLSLGYKQEQLARTARLTQPELSQIELGRRDPSPQTAERIARILGTSTKELFPELDNACAGRAV